MDTTSALALASKTVQKAEGLLKVVLGPTGERVWTTLEGQGFGQTLSQSGDDCGGGQRATEPSRALTQGGAAENHSPPFGRRLVRGGHRLTEAVGFAPGQRVCRQLWQPSATVLCGHSQTADFYGGEVPRQSLRRDNSAKTAPTPESAAAPKAYSSREHSCAPQALNGRQLGATGVNNPAQSRGRFLYVVPGTEHYGCNKSPVHCGSRDGFYSSMPTSCWTCCEGTVAPRYAKRARFVAQRTGKLSAGHHSVEVKARSGQPWTSESRRL